MMGFVVPLRRDKVKGPVYLSSAYRCPEYNARISKTGYRGPHTTGKAVDVVCFSSRLRDTLIRGAMELGCVRMGVAKDFIHFDMCDEPRFPKNAIWTYQ